MGALWLALIAAQVPVEVVDCEGVTSEGIERILNVELRTHLDQARALIVTCSEDKVFITLRTTNGEVSRVLTPGARKARVLERLVALAASELPSQPRVPIQPVVAPVVVVTPAPPPARWRVDARASFRGYPAGRLGLWGGRLSAGWQFTPHGWLTLEGQAEKGTAATALGSVEALAFSGGVATQWVQSLLPRLSLEEGVGLAAGQVRLWGTPVVAGVTGNTLTGWWWGPLARVSISLRVFDRVQVLAGIEAGWALNGAAGSVPNEAAVAVAGAWLSGVLGVGGAWD